MTKTPEFCSIYQEMTDKSCLHLNLIILNDFHSFTVNKDKLQNQSILNISANLWVCDLGRNLKFTKTLEFCSIHQQMTYKSCLHSNLIIWADFHTFIVNEEKLQN